MPQRAEDPGRDLVLAVNAGSSSIKYALYEVEHGAPRRVRGGHASLEDVRAGDGRRARTADDYSSAAEDILRSLDTEAEIARLAGVGHRVVHGGLRSLDHQRVSAELLRELRAAQPLDLAHLPAEIALIELFQERLQGVPQVACFDTAFHRSLPRLAQLLPIPREYDERGLRRLGFHGLSFSYLMEQLERAGAGAADGRVILAHLGAGASLAAVHGGRPVDTSMAFTPTAGLVMATRPGDLDPGLLVYLLRTGHMDAAALDDLVSNRSGLLGISGTTGDMQALQHRRTDDVRAAEAVDMFCYQARKWIGAFAAALGGLDTLVFSGGIGEHAPSIRAAVVDGLDFLGVWLDGARNEANAPVISRESSPVTVRVIPTDEEQMIARIVVEQVRRNGNP